jgi:hypothetical protein
MATPHDALFHRIFSRPDHARALLLRALPAVLAAAIDWSTLAPVAADFVDDALRGLRADLLFVALCADGSGRRIYFLIEHKFGGAGRVAAQMQRYGGLVFQRHRELHPGTLAPAVIPVLVHHGPRPWRPERHGSPPLVLEPYVEYAGIVVFDLARMTEAGLLQLPQPPFAHLGLLCLQGMPRRSAAQAEAALRRWAELLVQVRAGDPGEDCSAISWYLLFVTGLTTERSARLFAELLGPEAEEIPMSTGARIEREARRKGLEEGRAEGREQGREEGRDQGRVEILLRLLTARFGSVTPKVEHRVRSGSASDLERWAVAVLTAGTVEQVFA